MSGYIRRKKPSVPCRWLIENGYISDKDVGLDYGCGSGIDAEELGWDAYDKDMKKDHLKRHYEVITCTYVLNVIPSHKERASVIENVQSLLHEDGKAFFSVRRDKKNLKGHNKTGYQSWIEIWGAEKIRETSTYAIYMFGKNLSTHTIFSQVFK